MSSTIQDAAQMVTYKTGEAEFSVYAVPGQVEKWRRDHNIPIVDVVESFDIYEVPGGGHTGLMGRPPKHVLERAFNTTNENEIVCQILERGTLKGKARIENNKEIQPSNVP